jgi:hypothetical protein
MHTIGRFLPMALGSHKIRLIPGNAILQEEVGTSVTDGLDVWV